MTELSAVSGVGPGAMKKLKAKFITTAELLAVQNPIVLAEVVGEGTARKIIRNARNLVGGFDFRSALDVERELQETPRLTFGIEEIDEHLRGGIETGTIVELYGTARNGKTQWCHQLAVRAQLPVEEGGLGGRTLWLDTEKSFKPHIIRANAFRLGLDPEVTLGNIQHAKVLLSDQLLLLFEKIPQLMVDGNYVLVILDSLTALFRQEFTGLGTLRERQATINQLLNWMRRGGHSTKGIFLYTNQVMANVGAMFGSPIIPVGGHVIAHASDYRFFLGKGRKTKRRVNLQDNAGIPEFTVEVDLGWGGFYKGAKEKKEFEPEIIEFLMNKGVSKEVLEARGEEEVAKAG